MTLTKEQRKELIELVDYLVEKRQSEFVTDKEAIMKKWPNISSIKGRDVKAATLFEFLNISHLYNTFAQIKSETWTHVKEQKYLKMLEVLDNEKVIVSCEK